MIGLVDRADTIVVRVDGVMVEAGRVKNATGSRMVGVTKILSDIDPSQKNIVRTRKP